MDTSNSMETAERAEAVPEPGSDTMEKEGRKLPAQFEHRAERIQVLSCAPNDKFDQRT